MASQNVYDTVKSFVEWRSWYDVAKDFQTLMAGILALTAATAGSFIAYRAPSLSFSGVMERIQFDGNAAAEERERLAPAPQRRRYGAFLRLQAQARRLGTVAGIKVDRMAVPVEIAKEKNKEKDARSHNERVEWEDHFGCAEFDEFKELEKAWKNIDLFPWEVVHNIDGLRGHLTQARESMTACLKNLDDKNTVNIVHAGIYFQKCREVRESADKLCASLVSRTADLRKRLEKYQSED